MLPPYGWLPAGHGTVDDTSDRAQQHTAARSFVIIRPLASCLTADPLFKPRPQFPQTGPEDYGHG